MTCWKHNLTLTKHSIKGTTISYHFKIAGLQCRSKSTSLSWTKGCQAQIKIQHGNKEWMWYYPLKTWECSSRHNNQLVIVIGLSKEKRNRTQDKSKSNCYLKMTRVIVTFLHPKIQLWCLHFVCAKLRFFTRKCLTYAANFLIPPTYYQFARPLKTNVL
jgi:hypothetical protein